MKGDNDVCIGGKMKFMRRWVYRMCPCISPRLEPLRIIDSSSSTVAVSTPNHLSSCKETKISHACTEKKIPMLGILKTPPASWGALHM